MKRSDVIRGGRPAQLFAIAATLLVVSACGDQSPAPTGSGPVTASSGAAPPITPLGLAGTGGLGSIPPTSISSVARGASGMSVIPSLTVASGSSMTNPAATQLAPAKVSNLIVKFRSEGATQLTECAATVLARRRSFAGATSDQSASLDALMATHHVGAGHALFPWRNGLSSRDARARLRAKLAVSAQARRSPTPPAPDLTNIYLLDLPGDAELAAKQFRADPHVEYAQPNYIAQATYVPNDPYFASSGAFGQTYRDLWALQTLGASTAWDSARGQGAIVAVVDTGVDRNHPDLSPNMWTNSREIVNGIDDDGNGFIDDIQGWNFASNNSDPLDAFGHGTHVAGTIAAQDNNGVGIVGVAPDAKIMAVKGLGDTGEGTMFSLAQAIIYAAQNGADVINNSWGCNNCPSNPVTEDAVKLAHNLGAVVVFAAGNAAADVRTSSPSNYPYGISVSATAPNDALMSFSNFGLLDVAAPGGGLEAGLPTDNPMRGILSLKSATCSPVLCPANLIVNQSYLRQAGTSMAAPHVAGLAALIVSQHPTYTPEQIRQVIRRSSDDIGAIGYDPSMGYGRINASRAMTEPVPLEALIASPIGTLNGTTASILGTAKGNGFANFKLEYGVGSFPGSWTSITQSTSQVTEDQLASWNLATVVADGDVTLRLTATASDGRTYEDRQLVTLDRVKLSSPAVDTPFRGTDTVTIRGTVTMPGLSRYQLVVEDAITGAGAGGTVVLTGGGTSPVTDNVLGTWNTTGVATSYYRIRLNVTLQNGATMSEETKVIVDTALHAGWPHQIAMVGNGLAVNSIVNHMTVADVNQDGRSEIVMGYGPTLEILQHDGSALPGWPQSVDPNNDGTVAQYGPIVGDLDGDGKPEVIAATSPISGIGGMIFVWRANGTALPGWPKVVGGGVNVGTIADLDGDGAADLITGNNAGTVNAFRANGTAIAGFPVFVGVGAVNSPTVIDLDRDGKAEIVVALQGGNALTVLDRAGLTKPGWPKADSPNYQAVGDLDGDGDLEIVASTTTGKMVAYHHDGNPVAGWPKDLNSDLVNNPSVADIDGDGRAEVFVGTAGRFNPNRRPNVLYGWTGAGVALAGWPQTVNNEAFQTTMGFLGIALADVNNDGQIDIIAQRDASVNDFPMEVFRRDGTRIPGLARPMAGSASFGSTTPGIADIDGDGLLEMAYVDIRGFIYLWDLPGAASAARPWAMFQRDSVHSAASPAKSGVLLPARIEAENFARFSDSDNVNQGAASSPSCDKHNGVDIQSTADNGGLCNVGWTQPSEWLEYDVTATEAASYAFTLRVATGVANARLRLEIDGVSQGPKTLTQSNWQSFYDLAYRAPLTPGAHKIRVVFETTDVNLNYISIAKDVVAVPARIEAENYARFSDSTPANQGASGSPSCARNDAVDIETTADNNGRCDVGWTTAGEWLEYDLSVPTTGTWAFVARVAATAAGSRIHLELDGTSLGSRTLSNAGGQVFEDQVFTISAVAGSHTLRVVFETANVNFNYVYVGYVPTAPSRLEAEDYIRFFETDAANSGAAGSPQCNRGDGVDIEATSDNGGRCNVGWVQPGEWLEYKILRNSSNTAWSIKLRVGTGVSGKTIQVLLDGVNMGTYAVPNTGWGSFQDITVPITVPNQNFMHDLRVVFPVNDVNLNYITLN